MNKLTTTLAAFALVAGATFGTSLAANAATPYPAPSNATPTTSATVLPDGRVQENVGIGPGEFTPGAPVDLTVTGEDASAVAIAAFRAAVESQTLAAGTASSTGSLNASVVFPADATGAYNLSFSDGVHTVAASVTPIAAADTSADSVSAVGSGLASTGSYISLLTVWGALGLIGLGVAFVLVRTVMRRSVAQRAKA